MAVDTRKLKLEILLKVQEYGDTLISSRLAAIREDHRSQKEFINAAKSKLAEIALALHKLTESED